MEKTFYENNQLKKNSCHNLESPYPVAQTTISSRPAWAIDLVQGQPGQFNETPISKNVNWKEKVRDIVQWWNTCMV